MLVYALNIKYSFQNKDEFPLSTRIDSLIEDEILLLGGVYGASGSGFGQRDMEFLFKVKPDIKKIKENLAILTNKIKESNPKFYLSGYTKLEYIKG